jgi:signal transduction histidine kinase
VPADLPAVHHDSDAVVQCIINLVSNAAKYSDPGSTVRVSAQTRPDGGVDVAVADDGIGMSAEDTAECSSHSSEVMIRTPGNEKARASV